MIQLVYLSLLIGFFGPGAVRAGEGEVMFDRTAFEALARFWGPDGQLALDEIEALIKRGNSLPDATLTPDAVDAMFGILVPELFPAPDAWTPSEKELRAVLARLGSPDFRERKRASRRLRDLPFGAGLPDALVAATQAEDPEVKLRAKAFVAERRATMAHVKVMRNNPIYWGIRNRLRSLPAGDVRTRFKHNTMVILDPERGDPPDNIYCLLTHLVKLVTWDGTHAEVAQLIACFDQWTTIRPLYDCMEVDGKNQGRFILHGLRSKQAKHKTLRAVAWRHASPKHPGTRELLWKMVDEDHEDAAYIVQRLAGVYQDQKAFDSLMNLLREAKSGGEQYNAIANFEDVTGHWPAVPPELAKLLWPIANERDIWGNAEAAGIVLAKCPDPEWVEPLWKLYVNSNAHEVAADFIYFNFRGKVTALFEQVPNGRKGWVQALRERFAKPGYDPYATDYL